MLNIIQLTSKRPRIIEVEGTLGNYIYIFLPWYFFCRYYQVQVFSAIKRRGPYKPSLALPTSFSSLWNRLSQDSENGKMKRQKELFSTGECCRSGTTICNLHYQENSTGLRHGHLQVYLLQMLALLLLIQNVVYTHLLCVLLLPMPKN